MKTMSINLREEQIEMLKKLKDDKKIMSISEFFRRLLDQEIYKMVRMYDRFDKIIDSIKGEI